jgi:hypothetical protein
MFDPTTPIENASDYWLSKNNGTPAVAMSSDLWTSVAAECRYWDDEEWSYDSVLAFEWKVYARWNSSQGGREWPYVVWDDDYKPGDPCVVMNDNHKLWMCSEYKDIEEGYSCLAAWDDVDQQSPAHVSPFNDDGDVNVDHCFASTFVGPSYGERVAVVYSNHTDPAWGLFARTRVDNDWSGPTQVAPNHSNEDSVRARPSLAVTSCNGANYVVHCAYQVGESEPEGNPDIYYKTSTDYGTSWIPANPSLGTHLGKGKNPCVAAVGRFIFMCWHDQNNSNRIAYKFSRGGKRDTSLFLDRLKRVAMLRACPE